MTLLGFRRYVRNQREIRDITMLHIQQHEKEIDGHEHEWEPYWLNPEPRYYDAFICRICAKVKYVKKEEAMRP